MRVFFVLFLLFISAVSVTAATKTWTGNGSDSNWGTGSNWGGTAPVAGDDLVFPASAAQQATNNNLGIFTQFNTITIEGGTYTFGGNLIRLANGIITNGGTHTFNLAITLSGPQTFNTATGSTTTLLILSVGNFPLTLDGAGTLGIGLISGSGSVTKNGAGAAAIVTATAFSGPLRLNNGIFVVDANIPNSPVTIDNPTTTGGGLGLSGFGGTGTVGATTVTQGVISAGTLTSPTGVLNISNGLTFTANGNYVCKLSGTTPGANGHDQLNVTGSVNLNNARLAPIPWAGFRPALGDTYVILRNDGADPINGTFLNLPNNAIFSGPLNTAFKITYTGGDGNDIAIQRVARAPFDFDGDGRSDISIFRPSTTDWWYLSSINGNQVPVHWGNATDRMAPGDFDGDNKTDIATFRPSNGTWYIINSADSTFTIFQFGANGDLPIPNDFDGDGRSDMAVFRPSDGVWYQTRSLGNQFFAQQFGANGDIPQMMDYDGDGIGDLCVYRPTGGEWHFFQSSNSSYTAFPFGLAGDKPVPADFDGDGRTDVAVFRAASDSNLPDFYILTSGTFNYYGLSWGVPGDTPVVADYDGDGKADTGIFRQSDQTWYLLRSTAGFSSTVFGNTGDIPLPSSYIP